MRYAANTDLSKNGYTCFAGPFRPSEKEMIPKFIAEAKANSKLVEREETQNGVYLWQKRVSRK